jgi:hypothetical protein
MLTLAENLTVTGGGVRIRDAALMGGDHHEVVDLRTLPGDGGCFVLADNALITVTRTSRVRSRRPRSLRPTT